MQEKVWTIYLKSWVKFVIVLGFLLPLTAVSSDLIAPNRSCLEGRSSEEMAEEYIAAFSSYSGIEYHPVVSGVDWKNPDPIQLVGRLKKGSGRYNTARLQAEIRRIYRFVRKIGSVYSASSAESAQSLAIYLLAENTQKSVKSSAFYRFADVDSREKVDQFILDGERCHSWHSEHQVGRKSLKRLNIVSIVGDGELPLNQRVESSACVIKEMFKSLGFINIRQTDDKRLLHLASNNRLELSDYSQWLLWSKFSAVSETVQGKDFREDKKIMKNHFSKECS